MFFCFFVSIYVDDVKKYIISVEFVYHTRMAKSLVRFTMKSDQKDPVHLAS